jgi:sugar phosphate isomerase/epimerase
MEKDFEGTIKKVAAIGYREVEFAGYSDHSPKNVRAILDRHGLAAPSALIDYEIVEKQ